MDPHQGTVFLTELNQRHNSIKFDYEISSKEVHLLGCSVFDNVNDTCWAWEKLYKERVEKLMPERKAKVRKETVQTYENN